MKIHKIDNWEYWYDRSVRCWWAMQVDENGNQLDDAIHAYTKEEIYYAIQIN